MVVRLEHEGTVFGPLAVSLPSHLLEDKEERSLLGEVADDIAFALHNLEAEGALARERAELRATLYGIGDAVIATDAMGRVARMNPVAEQLTGWDEAAAGGRPLDEVFQVISEETRQPVQNPVVHVMREGQVVAILGVGNKPTEYTGKDVEVVSYLADVTWEIVRQKRAQEAARREGERAQRYLDIAEVLFVALDASGEVTLVNQKTSEVLGYEQEEIIGANWFDRFVPTRLRGEVSTVYRQLMAGEIEPVEYFENPVLTRDGGERIIAWHNTNLEDEEGGAIGVLSSGEDITERKRAEEQLRQALAEKEILLQELYHRTNNNMQVISTLIDFQADYIEDERALSAFADTKSRIQSMALVPSAPLPISGSLAH